MANEIEQDIDNIINDAFGLEGEKPEAEAPPAQEGSAPVEQPQVGADDAAGEQADAGSQEPAPSTEGGGDQELDRIRTAARYAGMPEEMIEGASPDHLKAWYATHSKGERKTRETLDELARLRREVQGDRQATGDDPDEVAEQHELPTALSDGQLDLEALAPIVDEFGEDGAKAIMSTLQSWVDQQVQARVQNVVQQQQVQAQDRSVAEQTFNAMKAAGQLGDDVPQDALNQVVQRARDLAQTDGPWRQAASRGEAIKEVVTAATRMLYGKLNDEVQRVTQAQQTDEARRTGTSTAGRRPSPSSTPKTVESMSTEELVDGIVDAVVGGKTEDEISRRFGI